MRIELRIARISFRVLTNGGACGSRAAAPLGGVCVNLSRRSG
ncbi:hypothetical protein C7S16_6801 [Burkholderia thailandensis]|uniref:Uncharacterized protein n=1 Tax=Burkholderia thailandensis TaxID=57975 RepID=A0AAW9CV68_BURTH|nr:hypothetical protein [Burkholderia thailandensis]MDW9252903.1 hypothetical protein [Burkholderia thailandensis]